MNYEVKPVQDCESVAIDELKSQRSEMLDQATAERQPLRVSMKDGREFLLLPQELLAPLCDNDFRLIVLSAMRYAMGRKLYCVVVTVGKILFLFFAWIFNYIKVKALTQRLSQKKLILV